MDVNKLHQALCNSLCFTLPGFHTFTGCDYTASYNRKGKIRPQKLFERSDDVKKKLFLFLIKANNENTRKSYETFLKLRI